ncbi:hypothetical protein FRC08_003136 [Ceratobasidium sp. 394]|nr:hypothetical protein FRC08_003136 [Ceratobasidium sp. 394]
MKAAEKVAKDAEKAVEKAAREADKAARAAEKAAKEAEKTAKKEEAKAEKAAKKKQAGATGAAKANRAVAKHESGGSDAEIEAAGIDLDSDLVDVKPIVKNERTRQWMDEEAQESIAYITSVWERFKLKRRLIYQHETAPT